MLPRCNGQKRVTAIPSSLVASLLLRPGTVDGGRKIAIRAEDQGAQTQRH